MLSLSMLRSEKALRDYSNLITETTSASSSENLWKSFRKAHFFQTKISTKFLYQEICYGFFDSSSPSNYCLSFFMLEIIIQLRSFIFVDRLDVDLELVAATIQNFPYAWQQRNLWSITYVIKEGTVLLKML